MKNIRLFSIEFHQKNTLQEQLYAHIFRLIKHNRLQNLQKLPATRALAEHLKISRNTVLLVYEQLKVEGILSSQQGSGFFVCFMPERTNTIKKTKTDCSYLGDFFIPKAVISSSTSEEKPFSVGESDKQAFPYT